MIFTHATLVPIGLVLALLVVAGLWRQGVRSRRLVECFGGPGTIGRLSTSSLPGPGRTRVLLLSLTALVLVAGAGEPVTREPESGSGPESRSVVLAIDASASMQATDGSPTRLADASRVAARLVGALDEHRVGLLLYAGETYVLSPPTRDHGYVQYLLGGLAPTVVSAYDPGTLLSEGIGGAVALLGERGEEDRSIVLVGDGESGEETTPMLDASADAAAEDIRIHAVGVGTEAGSEIVLPEGYQSGGRLVDDRGQPVVSRLREDRLRRIARRAGGRYVHSDDEAGLGRLEAVLAGNTGQSEDEAADPGRWLSDATALLAVAALVLLLLEALLKVRRKAPGSRATGRLLERRG